jgi:iron-sulfur cluster repair protein YtfE (RIC family)
MVTKRKSRPIENAERSYEILSEDIERLTGEDHPKLIEHLRKIEQLITHDRVKLFEDCDHVISRFLDFQKELTEHIQKEDFVIFPKILRAIRYDEAGMGDIKNTLYKRELTEWVSYHAKIREDLEALGGIIDILEACELHEATGDYFLEFEGLLRRHADFEDERLFPDAMELAINGED